MYEEWRIVNGNRLYEIRADMGISLQQASGLLGISKSTLCRYEQTSELRLSPLRIEDICRVYRVDPAVLACEKMAENGHIMLDKEQVADAYGRIDQRTRARISRILLRALD